MKVLKARNKGEDQKSKAAKIVLQKATYKLK